jgi:hypothetical protein
MTKSQCQVCGATFRGIPLITVKGGKKVEVCPPCYKKLDEEYRKNSCLACVFFNIGSCELFNTELDEPYINNATCEFFTTDSDPTKVTLARIKKLEITGRYEEAAREYEKIGMPEKAAKARKMKKISNAPLTDVNELVKLLAQRSQALTYYCCHCGASLKVGAKHEPMKTCPNCECDLTVIDLAKLINQHL